MEGRMKRLGKYKAVIALLCFTATIFSGCRKKPDAVITDGGDVTVVSAEHETVEESSADIFTYKDLKIGRWKMLISSKGIQPYKHEKTHLIHKVGFYCGMQA